MWSELEEAAGQAVGEAPTYDAIDQDLVASRQVAQSLIGVVRAALPVRAVMIAFRNGASLAIVLHDDDATIDEGQPRTALAAALVERDDRSVAAACAALMPTGELHHRIVLDRQGGTLGVIAVIARSGGAVAARVHEVLTRASAGLAGWLDAAASDHDDVAPSVLEHLREPALVHTDGIVVMANRAMSRLLGHWDPTAVIGRAIGTLIPGLPRVPFFLADVGVRRDDGEVMRAHVRERVLLVGGMLRRALVFRAVDAEPLIRVPIAACVTEAVACTYVTVRRVALMSVSVDSQIDVVAPMSDVVQALGLAILDVACTLEATHAATNRIEIEVVDGINNVAIDVRGLGEVQTLPRPTDHLAASTCGARVASLGGRLEIDRSRAGRVALRVVIPRAVATATTATKATTPTMPTTSSWGERRAKSVTGQ